MSWDAELTDDRGHVEHEANYTHNTNGMIRCALLALGEREPGWFDRLNGMSGEDSKKYLGAIIEEFEAFPDYYRRMNPDNGWGSFDSLLGVLKGMRDAVPAWPCMWRISG